MGKKKATGRGGPRPGSGRPTGADGPTMLVAVTVPEKLVKGLDDFAKAQEWNRSKAVTEAIRGLLARKRA